MDPKFYPDVTQSFGDLWWAALQHLQERMNSCAGDGADRRFVFWSRAILSPPVAEHLSFYVGNQLYCVQVEDAAGEVQGPPSSQLMLPARELNGYACRLKMQRAHAEAPWTPVHPGWGLVDARSGLRIDPPSLVTEQPIELTPREVRRFAVVAVCQKLEAEGCTIKYWHDLPDHQPTIWFDRPDGSEAWVVVGHAIFPYQHAARPWRWLEVSVELLKRAPGAFVSVRLESPEQPCERLDEPVRPLRRGEFPAFEVGELEPEDEGAAERRSALEFLLAARRLVPRGPGEPPRTPRPWADREHLSVWRYVHSPGVTLFVSALEQFGFEQRCALHFGRFDPDRPAAGNAAIDRVHELVTAADMPFLDAVGRDPAFEPLTAEAAASWAADTLAQYRTRSWRLAVVYPCGKAVIAYFEARGGGAAETSDTFARSKLAPSV